MNFDIVWYGYVVMWLFVVSGIILVTRVVIGFCCVIGGALLLFREDVGRISCSACWVSGGLISVLSFVIG